MDICQIVEHCLEQLPRPPQQLVYNMGGPERLSRVDIARAVARHFGYSQDSIIEGKSADVERYRGPLHVGGRVRVGRWLVCVGALQP
jgi:nucleoside-diphosphate-sugar epimerase